MKRLGNMGHPTANIRGAAKVGSSEELEISTGASISGVKDVVFNPKLGIHWKEEAGLDLGFTGQERGAGIPGLGGAANLLGIKSNVPGIHGTVHLPSVELKSEVGADLSPGLGAEDVGGVEGSLSLGGIRGEVNIPDVTLNTTGVLPGLGGKIDAALEIPDVSGGINLSGTEKVELGLNAGLNVGNVGGIDTGLHLQPGIETGLGSSITSTLNTPKASVNFPGLGCAVSVPGITSNVHGISGAVRVPSLEANAGLSTALGAVNVGGVDGSLNLGGIRGEVDIPDVTLKTTGALPRLGGKVDGALEIPDVSGGILLSGTEKVELGLNAGLNVGNVGGIDTGLNLQPGIETGLGSSITSTLNTPKASVNFPGLGGAVSVPGITSNVHGISGAVRVPSLEVNAGLSTALGAENVVHSEGGLNLGGIRGEVYIPSPAHF